MNPTGTKVICFSRFFYAFLCLCCLQTHVRVVCFVYVGSWTFGVEIALCLACWIPNFVRKVLKILRSFLNRMDLLGNRTSRFIGFGLPEWRFWYFALFSLVLGHSKSELNFVCLVRLLTF